MSLTFGSYSCPVPACGNRAGDPREVCGECREAFGTHVRPSATTTTAQEFTALQAAAARRELQVLAERKEMAGAAAAEWRPGQRCWCCQERRKCRQDPHTSNGWICKSCLEIT